MTTDTASAQGASAGATLEAPQYPVMCARTYEHVPFDGPQDLQRLFNEFVPARPEQMQMGPNLPKSALTDTPFDWYPDVDVPPFRVQDEIHLGQNMLEEWDRRPWPALQFDQEAVRISINTYKQLEKDDPKGAQRLRAHHIERITYGLRVCESLSFNGHSPRICEYNTLTPNPGFSKNHWQSERFDNWTAVMEKWCYVADEFGMHQLILGPNCYVANLDIERNIEWLAPFAENLRTYYDHDLYVTTSPGVKENDAMTILTPDQAARFVELVHQAGFNGFWLFPVVRSRATPTRACAKRTTSPRSRSATSSGRPAKRCSCARRSCGDDHYGCSAADNSADRWSLGGVARGRRVVAAAFGRANE